MTRSLNGRSIQRRFLVTGGAGFIGSHLTDLLVARGHEVLVLDNLSTGRRENLLGAIESGRVELCIGSTDDRALVDECMRSADVCVHLAAAVGVELVIDRPLGTLLSNIRGADCVISSAAEHGCPVLIASSSEVYGKNTEGSLSEDSDRLMGPTSLTRWAYANAKAFSEFLANAYAAERGAYTVVFRLFNTTGPRQLGAYGMVVPRFVQQALSGGPLTVYGDGEQRRCFMHVEDAVDAILSLAEEPAARANTFNIGASREVSIRNLAQIVIERTRTGAEIEYVPFEEAYGDGFEELGRRRPEIAAITSLTGWSPRRTLYDIVDDVIAHARSARRNVAA